MKAYCFPGVPTVMAMPRALVFPAKATSWIGIWRGVKSHRTFADIKVVKNIKTVRKREKNDIVEPENTQFERKEAYPKRTTMRSKKEQGRVVVNVR
jgi:hypothetical protein